MIHYDDNRESFSFGNVQTEVRDEDGHLLGYVNTEGQCVITYNEYSVTVTVTINVYDKNGVTEKEVSVIVPLHDIVEESGDDDRIGWTDSKNK